MADTQTPADPAIESLVQRIVRKHHDALGVTIKQERDKIVNAAAARGTLLSGGTVKALRDAYIAAARQYADTVKHGERILEQWPFPLDLESYKELEAYRKSPGRKPQVMFVPAGTFNRRRNRQSEPHALPPKAAPGSEE